MPDHTISRMLKRASQMPGGMFPVSELSPPDRQPPSLPGEPYELGLTSAGAISAGAYIAGAMDMLVEALDKWQAAKDDPALRDRLPDHSVLVRVVTGASAGAMNAALLAVLRDRAFTHLSSDPSPDGGEAPTGNPIFDAWVNRIDIDKLLARKDLKDGAAPVSLLDGTALPDIARRALTDAAALPTINRPWLADPLRVILTQTNCRGVPYFVPFAGSSAGQGMMQHGDQARFTLAVPGGRPDSQPLPFPDETPLTGAPAPGSVWSKLTDAAVASGAFPIGLPPRQMSAKPANYDYRVYFTHDGDLMSVSPRGNGWPLANGAYVGIDGGTIDNDPFGVAHDILAGGCGTNPRKGKEATRSVLMIDPFPEVPAYGPATLAELPLLKTVGNAMGVLVDQARFRPKDLILAHLEDVFSRFIVVPKRKDPVKGKYSLACGFLGGFGGFLSRRQRLHDFMLGRRNAQKLLLAHMALPADNPLFAGWRDKPFAQAYYARDNDGNIVRDGSGQPFLPIIPLLRDTGGMSLDVRFKIAEQQELPWPVGAVDAGKVAKQVRARAKALVAPLIKDLNFLVRTGINTALSLWGYGALEDEVREKLTSEADEWGLS